MDDAPTSMVDYEQLLPMSCHAHHRPLKTEDLLLNSTDAEDAKQQGTGSAGHPAQAQTDGLDVFSFGHIHHPVFAGVPGAEVQALKFTVSGGEKAHN